MLLYRWELYVLPAITGQFVRYELWRQFKKHNKFVSTAWIDGLFHFRQKRYADHKTYIPALVSLLNMTLLLSRE